jgi:Fe-S-cluster containining protein
MNECKEIGCPALCCTLTKEMLEWKPGLKPLPIFVSDGNGGYVCQYLQDGECSIYDRRPSVCEQFEYKGDACNNLRMKFIV